MPFLQILNGDHRWSRIELAREGCVLGRQGDGEFLEDDAWASREHARIERIGREFRLTDLDSENGTFLNDDRVDTGTLKNGDLIRVGKTEFRFVAPDLGDDSESGLDSPEQRVRYLEARLVRSHQLLAKLRTENERLKRLLAGGSAAVRPASGPGIHDTRSVRVAATPPSAFRYWSLGRQGLRLGQALLDLGAEDVQVVDQQVKRGSREDRPELDDLLGRCFGRAEDDCLLLVGLKALKLWVREPSKLPQSTLAGAAAALLLVETGVDLVENRAWLEWMAALGFGPLILAQIPAAPEDGFWIELAIVIDAFQRAERAGLGFLEGTRQPGLLATLGTSLAPEVKPQFIDGIVTRAADAGLLYPPFEGRAPGRGTLLLGGRPSGSERARFRRVFAQAFESSEIVTTRDFILADEGSGLRALVTVEGPRIDAL